MKIRKPESTLALFARAARLLVLTGVTAPVMGLAIGCGPSEPKVAEVPAIAAPPTEEKAAPPPKRGGPPPHGYTKGLTQPP